MADTVAEVQEVVIPAPTPAQKRKRGVDSSPETRRTKRGAPAATMGPLDTATAFMDENQQVASSISEAFTALQQAANDHPDASDPANAAGTAAAALGSLYPTIHVPPPTEETFGAQAATENEHDDSSYGGADVNHQDGLSMGIQVPIAPANGIRGEGRYPPGSNKPAVGSEEWHKMRKDNHKEVERRRRETINEGINELAKIVPNCEKNKGSILQRAVAFITQLKENETQNIEKWTLEKLLTEQAIAELSGSNDKLKIENSRLYNEVEAWKRLAETAGLSLKNDPNSSA